jgi:hypothetical protein
VTRTPLKAGDLVYRVRDAEEGSTLVERAIVITATAKTVRLGGVGEARYPGLAFRCRTIWSPDVAADFARTPREALAQAAQVLRDRAAEARKDAEAFERYSRRLAKLAAETTP